MKIKLGKEPDFGKPECPKSFNGLDNEGKKTSYYCTRVEGHKGKCQWINGQREQNDGKHPLGKFTEG